MYEREIREIRVIDFYNVYVCHWFVVAIIPVLSSKNVSNV